MAVTSRLHAVYKDKIAPELMKKFSYRNVMQVPKLEKIVVTMGVKDAILDPKLMDKAVLELMLITGQRPIVTKAKKSIAAFKLREGVALGCKVTLRRTMMFEFMDRFVNIALPRMRDFRGFSAKQFDGHGNFAAGLKEQIVFPEINYDRIDKIRGMNIVVVTTAKGDEEAKALLEAFHVPLSLTS